MQRASRLRCQSCNAPRKVSPCPKCGGSLTEPHSRWKEPRLPPIERIRELAKAVGYAVGVHGTLERDLDLVAVAWVDGAVPPQDLAEHIARGLNGRVLSAESKPLGRWACNIQLDGWFKLIDLSVAPIIASPPDPHRHP